MSGEPDPLYIAARRVLLDALTALRSQLDALILVGAQAVYVHAGEGDVAVAPFTTDGDLAIDPRRLSPEPLIEMALAAANFKLSEGTVGIWEVAADVDGVQRTVTVDLLVPESLGGAGRRGARIPPHATTTARKVSGLEAALVDLDEETIHALDPADDRAVKLNVAGPSALLVAKVHKMLDRAASPDRSRDKDALDVYRLLRAVPTNELVARFGRLLGDDISRDTTQHALEEFPRLFGSPTATGSQMAVRAVSPFQVSETLAASLVVLARDLTEGVKGA